MYSPRWSNCIVWALVQLVQQGGYILFRKSRWGYFPHCLWSPDLIEFWGYSPLDPRLKKLPPPLFRGQVVEEIVCREAK